MEEADQKAAIAGLVQGGNQVGSTLSDRTKVMLVWPVAGFFVVIAFGIGVIATAAFNSEQGLATASASSDGRTIRVTLGDLFIEPAVLQAPAGSVTFKVKNEGATDHNFAIEGYEATEMIPPGGSTTLEISDLKAGEYEVICEVAGHAGGGMTASLVVSGEV